MYMVIFRPHFGRWLSPVRALRSGRRGREFKSPPPDFLLILPNELCGSNAARFIKIDFAAIFFAAIILTETKTIPNWYP